jgi:hypothetical protein
MVSPPLTIRASWKIFIGIVFARRVIAECNDQRTYFTPVLVDACASTGSIHSVGHRGIGVAGMVLARTKPIVTIDGVPQQHTTYRFTEIIKQ